MTGRATSNRVHDPAERVAEICDELQVAHSDDECRCGDLRLAYDLGYEDAVNEMVRDD